MRALTVCLFASLGGCAAEYSILAKPVDVETEQEDSPDDGLAIDSDTPEPVTPGDSDDSAAPEDEPAVVASAPIYANTSERLYTVDPVTGAARLVGLFALAGQPVDGFVDIAVDPVGRLFGGTQGVGSSRVGRALYQIDPNTAALTHVCDLPLDMYAMAFVSDGRLVVGGREALHLVDVGAGCRSSLMVANSDYTTSGDLVGLPDGMLYWTVWGDEPGDSDRLVVLDPDGLRAPELRGVIGFDRLYGLAYDERADALYGFSADGEVVSIRRDNGQGRLLGTQTTAWWGATTNPVLWATP